MRALPLLLAALAGLGAGCTSTDDVLGDVTYGKVMQGDFERVVVRARQALRREFPLGLDPDRTDEAAGELWTVWRYDRHQFNRWLRKRAHVRVEALDGGRCRVGVSVVQQRNDNIENPMIVDEGKWVRTAKDQETAMRLERAIAQRYLKDFKPSEAWEEKHSADDKKGLRKDLVDRYRDVDLEAQEPGETPTPPTITGKEPDKD